MSKVSLWEVLVNKATIAKSGIVNTGVLLKEFTDLKDKLYVVYPEMKLLGEAECNNLFINFIYLALLQEQGHHNSVSQLLLACVT